MEPEAQLAHDSHQHQTVEGNATDQQRHYTEANIWTGHKQDPTYRRRKHSDYQTTPGTKGGAGKGKYDHMRQIVPDNAQHRTDTHQAPTPGASASTTGMHHPSQRGVWAQDSRSSPSTSSQHYFAPASSSTSAPDQYDNGRWPSWSQMES